MASPLLVQCRRLTKGEELPGFQEDGEYSERAFEAWLREQAILPAQVLPESGRSLLRRTAHRKTSVHTFRSVMCASPACILHVRLTISGMLHV